MLKKWNGLDLDIIWIEIGVFKNFKECTRLPCNGNHFCSVCLGLLIDKPRHVLFLSINSNLHHLGANHFSLGYLYPNHTEVGPALVPSPVESTAWLTTGVGWVWLSCAATGQGDCCTIFVCTRSRLINSSACSVTPLQAPTWHLLLHARPPFFLFILVSRPLPAS